jgi:hypothetical protein
MNFLEWYLRLPERPESEDVGWRVVLERARPAGVVEWAIAAAIVALAAMSLISYFRQSRELSPRLRLTLLMLRTLAIVLIILLLSGLGLTAQSVGRPGLVLMLDVSASMSTPDVEPLDRDEPGDAGERVSRLTVTIDRLLEDDARLLRELLNRYRVRIYEFGGDAGPVASVESPEDVTAAIERLSHLEPNAHATQPATAVETVLRDLRGQSIAAIVAFTDGVSSTGAVDSWTTAAESLAESQVPLAAVPIGALVPPLDVQIVEAHLPETAWVGQTVSFLAQIRCLGADGRDVAVELRDSASGELIATASFAVEGDDVREWVSLSLTPEEIGQCDYQATVVAIDDESMVHNNRVERSIDVRQGRIRVLLVERIPRWEFRHLKAILERDALIDLDTVLTWADAGYVLEDETALTTFPTTREEVLGAFEDTGAPDGSDALPADPMPESPAGDNTASGYDVIIWGDVDPESLLPEALTLVQDFVRLKGGGLIMLAGDEHNPWSYLDSPLAPLLPFPAEGFNVPRPVEAIAGFRPERTIDGRTFGFLRFDNDADQDAAIWESLPHHYWLLPIDRVKTGAQILAAHPALRGTASPLPAVLYQRFGAGQVIYLATDEFWQWRAGVEDLYLGRFWSQMVRSVTPLQPSSGELEGIRLLSRQPVYAEGEPIALGVEFSSGEHFPSDGLGEVVIERDSIVTGRVALSRSPLRPLALEGTGAPLPAGTYRAWLAHPSIPGELPSCRFEVDPGYRETLDTVVDRDQLEQAADMTAGLLLEFDELSQLARRLPAGRRVPTSEVTHIPLWSRPEPLLLLTLLLGCEWFLRRKHRLT